MSEGAHKKMYFSSDKFLHNIENAFLISIHIDFRYVAVRILI